ncbi:hypothetical protein NDU88_005551 [Pleurodeles waltl]|uniref:Uncharacterized protein n=1 Tax=Pleurodeles waltl TaxID=8319 RepID=A0AAV7NMT6_PLEWA|nr:hypothetical protein NDU88_005551 [Pleurodeles waltl]
MVFDPSPWTPRGWTPENGERVRAGLDQFLCFPRPPTSDVASGTSVPQRCYEKLARERDAYRRCLTLTEESEAGSSGYDLNKDSGSGSSEAESLAESLSPVAGPTVRPQRQHC